MGSMLLGGILIFAGLVLSFVPPFIFGPILFAVGIFVGIRGMGKTAAKSVKLASSAMKQDKDNPHA